MINVENHGDWIHLSLFNLQKDRVFIIVFFCSVVFFFFVGSSILFVCFLPEFDTCFFFSCFLLIGFRIWIHFSGVSFYFECAASRFQYNRWILFFSTWTIFGHLYDFHFISVHNSCLLLPMKEGNHCVIMIFCWYLYCWTRFFLFKINDQKWWQNNCKIWSWNFNIKY